MADQTLDVYARVSRIGDERQRSPEGQVLDCRARIEDRGDRVGEVFIDPGRSAWNPRVKRKAWTALMKRLEAGATDGVCVFDLARFSRRPIEGERLIAAAERGLVVLDSEGEYDLLSASGRKHFRDQLATAAYESDRLSTRVKRGKRLKAAKGEPNGTWRPFGFEPDGVTIREDEAAILRDLVDRLLAGEPQDVLREELNERGVLTTMGKPWTRAGLRQVLLRPRNAGHVEYRGDLVAKLPGEPIITQETYERVVSEFASRRRGRPVSGRYLVTSIGLCGRCRKGVSGRPALSKAPYPDGQVRREYWCRHCGRLAADQREVDRHVGKLVVAILSDPRHAAAVEAAARARADEVAELDAEIAKLEQLGEELAGRLGRREITMARFDAATKPLDRDLEKLRERRRVLGKKAPDRTLDKVAAAASREAWERRWAVATPGERRVLLQHALRGRPLVILPVDRHAPRVFDERRIVIED